MQNILITGGAGYIGSHTNALLNTLGYKTIVLDSLVYGHKQAIEYTTLQNLDPKAFEFLHWLSAQCQQKNINITPSPAAYSTFIQADLGDKAAVDKIFKSYDIAAVIHFAAFAYVGESVQDPAKYYRNNIANTLNLLELMHTHKVKHIIFSSTCATYGNPLQLPITESHPQNPINPYGYSKLVVENMLKDFAHAYDLHYVILRYFNAAGASMFFDIGESHSPETHLIPIILQTALGKRESLSVFGNDYETKDGSCVRDYIHVDDLSSAHILALRYLQTEKKSEVFNLGNGAGFSVFEVLECAQKLCKKPIPHHIETRREGDPAVLIGDSNKAQNILGWKPYFGHLEHIVSSALRWHANARY